MLQNVSCIFLKLSLEPKQQYNKGARKQFLKVSGTPPILFIINSRFNLFTQSFLM